MKNSFTLLATFSMLFLIGFTSCAQDKIIPSNKLPKQIITFVETHFPDNSIIQASFDRELFSKSYEVILKDNIKLDFNSKNKATSIEGNSKLPDKVIPTQILEYVKMNYNNNVIIEWEIDDKKQQVKLDNGLELEFTIKGDFLRIDG
ncbi:MAG: PepSY-like domain-containing protein [Bacteroidales bacterium]|nr:PepSY-like domain-containing protein [Bacteroidales bacterium]MDY0216759.1 PepSY-like domain-containing protein [Bacteroidales bacterium]